MELTVSMHQFGSSLLSTLFREQSKNWTSITLCYVSRTILIIHHFIKQTLAFICSDPRVWTELWENQILEALQKSYDRAMKHANFLLKMEREGIPYTLNHYFNDNLQKAQNARFINLITKVGRKETPEDDDEETEPGVFVPFSRLHSLSSDKSNSDQLIEYMHDVLESYYKVALKRFVDVVCQQVVNHFLLSEDGESPLQVLTPKLVRGLSDEQLDQIAGEDAAIREHRAKLSQSIEAYELGLGILKGSVRRNA